MSRPSSFNPVEIRDFLMSNPSAEVIQERISKLRREVAFYEKQLASVKALSPQDPLRQASNAYATMAKGFQQRVDKLQGEIKFLTSW